MLVICNHCNIEFINCSDNSTSCPASDQDRATLTSTVAEITGRSATSAV